MKCVPYGRTRTYKKYIYTDFVQPTLTSNNTMGGDKFATNIYFGSNNGSWGAAYTAFSPNNSNVGFYCDEWGSSAYFTFYNPNPLKITNFQFQSIYVGSSSGGAYNCHLWGGNFENDRNEVVIQGLTIGEGSLWNSPVSCVGYYKYFTFYFQNGGHSYEDRVDITNILIKGTEKKEVAATSTDYTEYEDHYSSYGIVKKNNKYYVIDK